MAEMDAVSSVLNNPNLHNILEKIFSFLDPCNVKTCSLVSR